MAFSTLSAIAVPPGIFGRSPPWFGRWLGVRSHGPYGPYDTVTLAKTGVNLLVATAISGVRRFSDHCSGFGSTARQGDLFPRICRYFRDFSGFFGIFRYSFGILCHGAPESTASESTAYAKSSGFRKSCPMLMPS